jgi:hypothetical protein
MPTKPVSPRNLERSVVFRLRRGRVAQRPESRARRLGEGIASLGSTGRRNSAGLPGATDGPRRRHRPGSPGRGAMTLARESSRQTPTLGAPRPSWAGSPLPGPQHEGERIISFIPYTAQFNMTGQPAISLPPALDSGQPAGRRAAGGRLRAGGPTHPGRQPARASRALDRPHPPGNA